MKNKWSMAILVITSFLCLYIIFPLLIFSWPAKGREGCANSAQANPQEKELGQRQRLGENLALLKLIRMTKALDLTEEQAARIFPMANRLEKERMGLNRQLNQEIRELRSLVIALPPDEAKIEEKVARIRELRESIRQKDAEFEVFLEKNLTVVQRGKYILFNLDFAQLLSRNLERIRNLQEQLSRTPIKRAPEK